MVKPLTLFDALGTHVLSTGSAGHVGFQILLRQRQVPMNRMCFVVRASRPFDWVEEAALQLSRKSVASQS